ncbi:unnamed protein product [Protopolystoma xenopodis]|uniref:Uncharacterized protein n=1 Tax=Protopolystoma xenopodis TaxID=117903 RepID=A0A448WGD5_9PLAT|nr:unnamed protein product [Protopolystoma xenopodis]
MGLAFDLVPDPHHLTLRFHVHLSILLDPLISILPRRVYTLCTVLHKSEIPASSHCPLRLLVPTLYRMKATRRQANKAAHGQAATGRKTALPSPLRGG